MLRTLLLYGEESSQQFQEMMEIRCGLSETRYLNSREPIPKTNAMQDMLFSYPDREFQYNARRNVKIGTFDS